MKYRDFSRQNFLCVLLLLCHHFINAQQHKVDRLLGELKEGISDTTRLRIYADLSLAYNSVDPERKFYYANKMRLLANKNGIDSLEANAYQDMGISYGIRNRVDSAIFYFSRSYVKSKQAGYRTGMARSLVNMGFAYDRSDNKEAAIEKYRQALTIYKQIGKTNEQINRGINQCYINIGSLYYDLGQYKLSEDYFAQALQRYTASGDKEGIIQSLFSLGNTYRELKDYPKSRIYYGKSLAMAQDGEHLNQIALGKWGLGQLDLAEGKHTQALSNFEESLKINRKIRNEYNKDAVLISMAEAYLVMGQLEMAEKYALEAYQDGRRMNSKVALLKVLPFMTQIYKKQGEFKKALEYQTHYVNVSDSLQSEKVTNNVVLADFDRVRSENSNLVKDNTKIIATNTSYATAIVIISVLLLLVLLLLVLYYKKNKEKKAINALLQSQKEEIALQNAELEQLNNVKNKFFSIVSHDLRSPIATLKMLFGLYRRGELDEREFSELLSRLEDTIYTTAVFLDNLLEWSKSQLEGIVVKPVSFDIREMVEENIHLLDSQIKAKQLEVTNRITVPLTVFADPNMINVVVRNIVSNAVKFCNPNDRIEIKAAIDNSRVIIFISDSGPGIAKNDIERLFNLEHTITTSNTGEKGHQIGLILCKDMVEQNNGHITVESTTGQGTVFGIELPRG